MSALLRAGARRGDLVGAGAVVLGTTVTLVSYRFEEEWGIGVHVAYSALAAAIVIALAARADRRPDATPARWHSVLFVTSFVLALAALVLPTAVGAVRRVRGLGEED
jgi:hypothetical protein